MAAPDHPPVSTTAVPDDHVVLGQIGKPFGTNGEVYVFADLDLDESFDAKTSYRSTGPEQTSLTVARSRRHGDRLVVAFRGIGSREQAQAIRGALLSRPRAEVTLDEESVWVSDLVGRTVVDDTGETVGTVNRIQDGYAHDYLAILRSDGAGTALVPMVPELLDWTSDPIRVSPIPGLLDPDEAV